MVRGQDATREQGVYDRHGAAAPDPGRGRPDRLRGAPEGQGHRPQSGHFTLIDATSHPQRALRPSSHRPRAARSSSPAPGASLTSPLSTAPLSGEPPREESGKPPVEEPAEEPPTEEPSGYAATGRWTVLEDAAAARSVHAVLLQNGKLLIMAGLGQRPAWHSRPAASSSYLYDPVANTWQELETPKDVFCSGHVQLADGNVLILGGTSEYPPEPKPGEYPSTKYKGENASWIFNIHNDKYENVPYNEARPQQLSRTGAAAGGRLVPERDRARQRRRDLLRRARTSRAKATPRPTTTPTPPTKAPTATWPASGLGSAAATAADLRLVLGRVPLDDPHC